MFPDKGYTMDWNVDFEVIHGSSRQNPAILISMATAMKNAGIQGTFFIGYPVMASADSSVTIDALLVSQAPGLVAFHFASREENYKDEQDRLYYVLEANLARHESLRKKRELGIKINIVTIFPEGEAPKAEDDFLVATPSTFIDVINKSIQIDDSDLFRKLCAAVQRVTTIKPHKKRYNANKPGSRGTILKHIEKEIANLDRWQKEAAIETPEGPQRIRGLAGSGKTVVLALKAAYLHTQHPDWNIAVTFHTQSLYPQFKDLIERFTLDHMGDKPDWKNLQVMHSWGSSYTDGIYSTTCNAINLMPANFLAAKTKYGTKNAFSGACKELVASLGNRNLEIYDVLLIDEAQDLPQEFFQIADRITKEPKRIIWAYDELQNLSDTNMATTSELFGRDIFLTNDQNAPKQDIILPVCYRNTPWALTLAHALGFGLFREPRLVQHFDQPELWMDIGYIVEYGLLDYGQQVTLSRGPKSYPSFFTELLTSTDAVRCERFESKEQQYAWIAEQININIQGDELDPDDILIILPNPLTQKNEYYDLRKQLDRLNIDSFLAGVTNDRDKFYEQGRVTVSGIYRAKGNEAPMVYIVNSDYCAVGHEMIRLRNILFTSITRSRAWVSICGVGNDMDILRNEIDHVTQSNFKLSFKIPVEAELEEVRRINRDRTSQEISKIRKAEKNLSEVLELIESGVISPEAMPQLRELIRRIKGHED
jgi:superfamily I DNA and RNA helicase